MTQTLTLTNVNPDFYRTDVTESGARYPTRTLIFATVEMLTIGRLDGAAALLDDISPSKNLTINAVHVTLATDLHIPGGDVRICCKTLTIAARKHRDGEPARTRLDVSEVRDSVFDPPHAPQPLPVTTVTTPPTAGQDGDAIAQANRGGALDCALIPNPKPEQRLGCVGSPGGRITLICDQIFLGEELLLVANGSQGYPGSDGQRGGPAAPTDDPIASRKRQGGQGGRGGHGGVGGGGGSVELRYHAIDYGERLVVEVAPGKPGEPGLPGKGGEPHGVAGAPAAPTASGERGDVLRDREAPRARLGAHFDVRFLIKHLQMSKRLYLFNSPTKYSGELEYPQGEVAWGALGEQLRWATELLSDYATAKTDDARPDAIAKRELYNGSNNLLSNHQDNLTYFGRSADWMPSAPIEVMTASFEASWESRAGIEADFRRLSLAYEVAKKDQAALDAAKLQVDRAVKTLFAQYQGVLDGLQGVPDRITRSLTALGEASTALSAKLNPTADFATKVTNHFGCPSIADIVKAAEMIAFTIGPEGPGAATAIMTGIEAAGMINDGIQQIETNDKRKVPKANILHDIVNLKGRLKDAVSAELLVLDENGKPTFDPAQKMMLTSLDAFEDEVNNLTNELGDVSDLVSAIESFKATLYDKGEAIVLYHLLIRQLLEQYAGYQDAKARQTALQQEGNPLDPYGIATVSYMAKLYQEQLEQVLEDVAQLSRKYTYVLPDKRTLYDPAAQFANLWVDGSAPNAEGMTILKGRVDAMAAQLVTDQSELTSSKNQFPAASERGDLFVHIQEGPLLDRFRRTQRIRFRTISALETVDPNAKVAEVPVENSDRYWDVRITHAQVRIVGATATHKEIFVGVRMASVSSIYGVKTKYTFSFHSKRGEAELPRYATMIQSTDARIYQDAARTTFCTENTDMSGDLGKLADQYLDALGMFSVWELSVPKGRDVEGHNAGLDISKVTEISVHFRGWRRGGKT